jgi:hypothetical protein
VRIAKANHVVVTKPDSPDDNNQTNYIIKEEDGRIYVANGSEPVLYIREFTPTSPEKKQYAAGIIQIITSRSGEKLADDLIHADMLARQYQIETEIFDASEGSPVEAIMRLVKAIEQAQSARAAQSLLDAKLNQRTSLIGLFAKRRPQINLMAQFDAVAKASAGSNRPNN